MTAEAEHYAGCCFLFLTVAQFLCVILLFMAILQSYWSDIGGGGCPTIAHTEIG